MRTIIYLLTALLSLLLAVSCQSGPTLQQYFVASSENPEFISFDIPASILKTDGLSLTPEQKEAYESIKKLNVLALKLSESNKGLFETEKEKIKTILANERYQELMRLNSGSSRGVVKFVGTGDAIDEVILYGTDNQNGLALVRVLGNNMKVENIGVLMDLIQKSGFNGEGLGQLGSIFGRKNTTERQTDSLQTVE